MNDLNFLYNQFFTICENNMLYWFANLVFQSDFLKEIKEILKSSNLKEIIWVQEEPRNRGAWKYFNENIIEIHENKLKLKYVGRKPSATTATGSSSVHKIQQKRIIDSILK